MGCGSMSLATDAVHSIQQSLTQHCFASFRLAFFRNFLDKSEKHQHYISHDIAVVRSAQLWNQSCECVSVRLYVCVCARALVHLNECLLRLPYSSIVICAKTFKLHAHAFLIISLSEVGRFGDAINFIGITSGRF